MYNSQFTDQEYERIERAIIKIISTQLCPLPTGDTFDLLASSIKANPEWLRATIVNMITERKLNITPDLLVTLPHTD